MTVEDQNDEGTNCILNTAEADAGGKCVWMKDCIGNTASGQTSNNQAFYYDPNTYAIRTFENYCLEYDTGTGVNNTNEQEFNLYASPSCTGATNQVRSIWSGLAASFSCRSRATGLVAFSCMDLGVGYSWLDNSITWMPISQSSFLHSLPINNKAILL